LTDVDSGINVYEFEPNCLSAAVSVRMPMNLAVGALCSCCHKSYMETLGNGK